MDAGIQKYRAFVVAADTGSIARAAEQLGYAVSSVSRMISDLERSSGLRLFDRSKTGVVLTADGQHLLASARAIVADCENFAHRAASVAGAEIGTVRIGTIGSVVTHVLPRILESFRHQHPGIDYEFLLGDYAEIETWLAEGRADLGTLRIPAPSWCDTTPLLDDEHVAVVPNGHRLARRKRFPLKAFSNEPFLALERDGVFEVADLLQRNNVHLKPAFTIWDDYAIMAMVEAGLGLSILPSVMMKRCAYHITALPLDVPAKRNIVMAWHHDRALPAAADAFLHAIHEHAGTY